jgi:hypothetical protein
MNENDFDQENENTQEVEASELDTLRARADLMGIEYRHNTGVSKLRKLVEAKLEPVEEVAENVGLTKSQRVAKLRSPCTCPNYLYESKQEEHRGGVFLHWFCSFGYI